MKKVLSILLVLALGLSLFAGCAKKESNSSDTGSSTTQSNQTADQTQKTEETPKADETSEVGGEIRMLTNVTGGKDDEEMKLFAEALGKATGMKVTMEKPASDYTNVVMQKLQGGEKYDLIYVNMQQYLNLVEQGALLDLTDFIKSSKIFSDPASINPQELKDIEVDGKIYAGFNKKEIHRVVGMNKIHLQSAQIDYKQIDPTLDGYYDVFKKLKAAINTPNYYPFNAVVSEVYDLQPWFASLGLKSGVVIDSDGKKYVPFSTDAAAPVWEWFAKLYKEGLIDPASAVDKTKDLRAKMGASSQLTSVTVDWAAWIGLHNANALAENIGPDKYEIVSLPGTKTPDGNYMLTKGSASLWVIPANAPNPEGAKKMLEFFASQEGGELLSVGIEGHDYTVENGKYVLTEIGKAHGNDHGAPVPIFEKFQHPIGFNPGFEEAMSYGKYASIELPISNEGDYKEIVGKWGVQIMKGEVSAAEGLASMREELISRKVTDK